MMSESQLKSLILGLAADHGWKVMHLTHDGVKKPQKSAKGYPDLTLARRGVVHWWELKDAKGQMEPEQVAWSEALPEDADSGWRLIRPADLEDGTIEALLR